MSKDNGLRPIEEIDPRDPNLTDAEKRMIMVRCQNDPAYFLEKVVGIKPLAKALTVLHEATSHPAISFKPYPYQPLCGEESLDKFKIAEYGAKSPLLRNYARIWLDGITIVKEETDK